MKNIPEVKLGIIAVSRDCFPIALSISRREAIVKAFGEGLYECKVTVENEKDMLAAVEDVKAAGCNALTVFASPHLYPQCGQKESSSSSSRIHPIHNLFISICISLHKYDHTKSQRITAHCNCPRTS